MIPHALIEWLTCHRHRGDYYPSEPRSISCHRQTGGGARRCLIIHLPDQLYILGLAGGSLLQMVAMLQANQRSELPATASETARSSYNSVVRQLLSDALRYCDDAGGALMKLTRASNSQVPFSDRCGKCGSRPTRSADIKLNEQVSLRRALDRLRSSNRTFHRPDISGRGASDAQGPEIRRG
jgi:hypothetical protein